MKKIRDEIQLTLPLQEGNAYYRSIFDRVDKDGNGKICIKELHKMVNGGKFPDLSHDLIAKILEISDINHDGHIDFDEFVSMLNNPKLKTVFGHYITNYINFINGLDSKSDANFLKPDQIPIGMILISIVEIILYTIDKSIDSEPILTHLQYDPTKRKEFWRFLSYMFVHVDLGHIIFNLIVQIIIGLPLEMAHGPWRIMAIYFCGVIAGSLGTSLTDPATFMAGASGGVFALITAHMAAIVMNWSETRCWGYVWMALVTTFAVYSASISIYDRYHGDKNKKIAYVAHIAGALSGFLVGINVVRNHKVTTFETYLWWICVVIFGGFVLLAILCNIIFPQYYPKQQ